MESQPFDNPEIPTRIRVLLALSTDSVALTAEEIGALLDLSPKTVNMALSRLIAKGKVERTGNYKKPCLGRPASLYRIRGRK